MPHHAQHKYGFNNSDAIIGKNRESFNITSDFLTKCNLHSGKKSSFALGNGFCSSYSLDEKAVSFPKKKMKMEDENFKKELEDLFRMFKLLLEKESLNDIKGIDNEQLEQLKLFMTQFDDIKDDLKFEMNQVDPFTRQIISAMVKQLRQQLGEDANAEIELSAEEKVARKEEELKKITDVNERHIALLETIDKALKNPDLTDEEIDALLDKRTSIEGQNNKGGVS